MRTDRPRRRTAVLLSALLVGSVFAGLVPLTTPVAATGPAGMAGSGTVGDPYVVTDVTQLQAVGQSLSANYVLGNDVDASTTAGWNSGAGFDPLGSSVTKFTGSFDGAGYTVSSLTVDRPTADDVGLFGAVGSTGTVSNVTVTGTVEGNDYVGGLVGLNEGSVSDASTDVMITARRLGGGLVGQNEGSVSNSTATGNVTGSINYFGGLVGNNDGTVSNSTASGTVVSTGSDNYFGGLVGYNDAAVSDSHASGDVVASASWSVGGLIGQNHAPVSRSTATGSVTGDTYVGGLVGYTSDAVSNASATGVVTGTDSVGGLVGRNQVTLVTTSFATGTVSGASAVGGLVGYNQSGTVTDSYWDTETTGQSTSAGGTGLTTAEMRGFAANDSMSGFAFYDVWVPTSSYPVLAERYFGGLAGDGTEATPYVVTDVLQLQAVAMDLSANYTLGNDVDASATAAWQGGAGFFPLGSSVTKFTGSFDGAGHTVSNLTIDRPTDDDVGLFGMTGLATITDTHLENASIDGDSRVGGLVGLSFVQSNVSHSSVRGTVTGNQSVGGLVGVNYLESLVFESRADVDVTGNGSVGGLVGHQYTNSVTFASRTSGTVVGTGDNVGGLVGRNVAGSTVANSSSNAAVTGSANNVGGLVGLSSNEGDVVDSRASGAVDGDTRVGGLVGFLNDSSNVSLSFATGAVTSSGAVGGLVGDTDAGVVVSDSYWDTETTGQSTSAGGTGLTTAEMTGTTAETTMSGLDFTSVWAVTGQYPRVQWLFDPPTVTGLTVTNPSGAEIHVTLTSDQQLATLSVPVSGAASATLSFDDFAETDNGDGSYTYNGTYTGSTSGTYTVTVDTAANGDGDDGVSSPSDSVVVDIAAPTANAGGDQTVRVDTPVRFDGSASTDDLSVVSYEWSFGDGSPTNTGVTTTHTYTTPGRYLVVVTVTDTAGTTSADAMTVTVQSASRGPASAGMRAPPGGSVTTSGTSVTVDFGGNEDDVVQSTSIRFGTQNDELLGVDRITERPAGIATTRGTFVSAVDITVSDDATNSPSTLQFAVSRTHLDALGVAPDQLQVEHYNDDTGEWEVLETTLVDSGDARVVLRAETPGFSMFAVTARSPPSTTALASTPPSSGAVATTPAPQPTSETKSFAEPSSTADDTRAEPSTTASTTPGFGVGVAVGALVLVVVARRRNRE